MNTVTVLLSALSSEKKTELRNKITKYTKELKDIPNRIKAKEAQKRLSTTTPETKRQLDASIKRYKEKLKNLPDKIQTARKQLSK